MVAFSPPSASRGRIRPTEGRPQNPRNFGTREQAASATPSTYCRTRLETRHGSLGDAPRVVGGGGPAPLGVRRLGGVCDADSDCPSRAPLGPGPRGIGRGGVHRANRGWWYRGRRRYRRRRRRRDVERLSRRRVRRVFGIVVRRPLRDAEHGHHPRADSRGCCGRRRDRHVGQPPLPRFRPVLGGAPSRAQPHQFHGRRDGRGALRVPRLRRRSHLAHGQQGHRLQGGQARFRMGLQELSQDGSGQDPTHPRFHARGRRRAHQRHRRRVAPRPHPSVPPLSPG